MPIPGSFSEATSLTPKGFAEACLPENSSSSIDLTSLSSLFNKDPIDLAQLKKLYSNTESLLVCDIDRLAGIKTRKLTTPQELTEAGLDFNHYPTGVAYYRDATDSDLLKERVDPNDPRYARNELMLRVLNIVRGMDHAFEQLADKTGERDFYAGLRFLLVNQYSVFLEKVDSSLENYPVKDLERAFNTSLVELLHDGYLDVGIKGHLAKSYEKLLLQYRFLAATLEPAAAMVTVFKDHEQNVGFREVALPVTQKTSAQKAEIAHMNAQPSETKNYHTAQPKAVQLAQAQFAELVTDDQRMLGAQHRKTMAPGCKNSYHVTLNVVASDQWSETYSWARTGTVAYIGQGESPETLKAHAIENLKQITAAVKTQHLILLNTDTRYEKESIIVRMGREAVAALKAKFSHVPVNVYGSFHPIQISADAAGALNNAGRTARGFADKAARSLLAAEVAFQEINSQKSVPIIACASGQDRTGVVHELLAARCMADAYEKNNLEVPKAVTLRTQALVSPFLATLTVPGSRGLKTCSQAGDLLGKHIRQFHLPGADTAKSAPVIASSVEAIAGRAQFFDLNLAEGAASLRMKPVDVVKTLLEAYKRQAESPVFWKKLFGNQAFSGHKITEVSNTLRAVSEEATSVTLTLLKTKLQDLRDSTVNKAAQINQFSFFKHGPGRLEATVDLCLAYLGKMEEITEVAISRYPSPQ